MNMMPDLLLARGLRATLALSALLLLSACGGEKASTSGAEAETADATAASQDFPPYDNTEEVQAYYDANPALFVFSSIDALPGDLKWEDGSDLPEIGDPDAIKGGTLNAFMSDYPRTLRLIGPDSNGSFRTYILDDVRMSYAQRHPNVTEITETGFHYFPGIADRWALDKANRTVYVQMAPEARWSDGEPITTEDVAFAFYFWASPYNNAPWYQANLGLGRDTYEKLTIYDDHTFALTLKEARPDMKGRALGLIPLPRHFFREFGPDYVERYQWRFVPTDGAYILTEEDIRQNRGKSATLVRLKDWWAKDRPFWRYRYNFDRIEMPIIRDPEKAFQAFKKGDIDATGLVNIPKYWYDELPDEDPLVQQGYVHKVTFYNDIPRPTYALWINRSRPLLNHREVREGIQYAMNWEAVIEKYFRGDVVRMRTTSDGYGDMSHPTLTARPFDVLQALDHFAQAGFTERGADGVLRHQQTGQRLSFTLTTGYKHYADMLAILKEEAIKAGLELRLEVLEPTSAFKKVQEKKHDISFMAFGTSPEMYPRYWETWHSANAYDQAFLEDGTPNPDRKVKAQTNNLVVMADYALDQMIDRYRQSDDINEMRELAFAMEEILHDDAAFVPGWVQPFIRGAKWRWIQHPEDYNVKLSGNTNYWLSWIDPALKAQTLEAMKRDEAFPPVIEIYDQYKIGE